MTNFYSVEKIFARNTYPGESQVPRLYTVGKNVITNSQKST